MNTELQMLIHRENELLEQMAGMENRVEKLRQEWIALRTRKSALVLSLQKRGIYESHVQNQYVTQRTPPLVTLTVE
jgi:hypothetical protein